MSRVGKMPITIPDKVKVRQENGTVFVEGPKGKHQYTAPSCVSVAIGDKEVVLSRQDEQKQTLALHGTARAILNNMIFGVSTGFSKSLDIVGVGYRAEAKGKELVLLLGYSNPVHFPLPEGVEAHVEKQTRITISANDKQVVGEVAAKIRDLRPPEPYKGKGIRYVGEVVKQKVGKAAATASS